MVLEDARPHLEETSPDPVTPPNGCRIVRPTDGPAGLTLMVHEGRIVRADVSEGATTTPEGARVGETEARVLELYPDARRRPHKYTDGFYLIAVPRAPADTLHRYVFEMEGARVTRFRAGAYPQVEWVEGCS